MNTKAVIKLALEEDIPRSDITTTLFIPKNKVVSASIIAKESGVVCGLDVAREVFRQLDRKIVFKKVVHDGQKITKGQILAKIRGNAQAILSAERTALNFLQRLSGIATLARKYVEAVRFAVPDSNIKIYDTRKTTPLLRKLEKYAVRCGGGYNHRMNLSEMILLKDNHLKIISKLPNLEIWKFRNKKTLIEVEVQSFNQLKKVLVLNPDIIMLDNMSFKLLKKCIKYIRKHSRCEIEVSGNVNLKTIKKLASCKPDRISVGSITHSACALDVSLEITR